jgi:hypothetical protein
MGEGVVRMRMLLATGVQAEENTFAPARSVSGQLSYQILDMQSDRTG